MARSAVAALVLLGLGGCAHASDLPPFEVWAASLPGPSVSAVPYLPDQLRGRVVLVTFVATWCFPCLTDLATLEKLEREYGAKGFSNVLVGMDLDGATMLAPFAQSEDFHLGAPLLVADDRLRAGLTPFGPIKELPSRVLFARDGAVVGGYSGVAQYETLARVVAAEIARGDIARHANNPSP